MLDGMVRFYLKRIEFGVMSLEEVPVLWREKVRIALEKQQEAEEAEN